MELFFSELRRQRLRDRTGMTGSNGPVTVRRHKVSRYVLHFNIKRLGGAKEWKGPNLVEINVSKFVLKNISPPKTFVLLLRGQGGQT